MTIKLFILGNPGSGKSTAYRHIKDVIDQQYPDWSIIRFHDYAILQRMFFFEKLFCSYRKNKQFREAEHGGFDVLDFTVMDKALKKLEKEVRHRYDLSMDELIVIELARDNYYYALKQFKASFLEDAYFLFIEADLGTCIQRAKNRVTDPPTPDNHFVSEDILTQYYGKRDSKKDLLATISRKRLKVINSTVDLQDFEGKAGKYINIILSREIPLSQYKVTKRTPDPQVLTPLLSPIHR
jgi:type IV secretory pathway ATPase VirB11/archaellum biosynthesis ATPase